MHTHRPRGRRRAAAHPAGPDFDRTFLNLFTGHQHGAVELARMESRSGKYPGAEELAGRIVESRTAQIRQMARLLAR